MITIGTIYEHYKGSLYKVIDISFHHETGEPFVIYHKCDKRGIFISIREGERIINQPFFRSYKEFNEEIEVNGIKTKRFKFYKTI